MKTKSKNFLGFARVAILVVGLVLPGVSAHAAPGDWFEYTNEVGDNDPANILNWRWGHDTSMPAGVTAYGHPTSLAQLQTTRSFLSGAGSGFCIAKGNVYNVAEIGPGQTFQLTDAQIDGASLSTSTVPVRP